MPIFLKEQKHSNFSLHVLTNMLIYVLGDTIELYLIYISMKHYDDFDVGKVIYDE